MNLENWVTTDDLCAHYRVESRFVQDLHNNGLIEMHTIERHKCIPVDQISEFERMRRLHYDMHINVEGLEVVKNLLEKIDELQREKQALLNRIRLYE